VTGRAAQAAGAALRAAILRRQCRRDARAAAGGGTVEVAMARGCRIDLAALPADADGYVLVGEETYDPPTTPLDADGQGVPYAVYGYGAQMVELASRHRTRHRAAPAITAAHDVGRAINPTLARARSRAASRRASAWR
jgi:aldehyde oxidoreductase